MLEVLILRNGRAINKETLSEKIFVYLMNP